MARRLVDVMTGYHVVDASIEDGVSATLMGRGGGGGGGGVRRYSHPSLLIRHLLISRQAPRHM